MIEALATACLIALAALVLAPLSAYLCVRLGTFGYLRAKRLFSESNQGEDTTYGDEA